LPEALLAPTVAETLSGAAARLAEAGCDTPRLDAELLLAEALQCARAALVTRARDPLAPGAAERFGELLVRRAEREPVAYILGGKEFRRITLAVDRRVLIPRPETELLVEVGLGLPTGSRVVDVGTGSGAVALALADERPDLEVWGTDVSGDALAVARENALRLGLGVRFVPADLLDGVERRFDAVLANLPYVPEGDALPPEIVRYEPPGALFAGADGLDVIRRLLRTVSDVPLVALEVGAGQAPEVSALMHGRRVERLRDLAGHERVVLGRL
jgi:release factor glutamine methyltransferase